MNKRNTVISSIFGLGILSAPNVSFAVLPPDLVVSVGAQIAGFFSVFVVVIGSIFASIGAMYYGWYTACKKNIAWIVVGVLAVVLVLTHCLYLAYVYQVFPFGTSVPEVVVPVSTPPVAQSHSSTTCTTCQFYSDSITLFVPDEQEPFVLELDMNRRQEKNGQYTHYYFLNGLVSNAALESYEQFVLPADLLHSSGFLEEISRQSPEDFSVRDTYRGLVAPDRHAPIEFSITDIEGDFITRNRPEYTQFQSVGQAAITHKGETKNAFALVEALHSNDFQKRVFFPGFSQLESRTYQFILWDEDQNFYFIDDTQVFSNTPEYPAHSWLLYKEAATGLTKKGFDSTVVEHTDTSWTVTAPAFSAAVFTLSEQVTYKDTADGRKRAVVVGTVTDSNGTKKVSGVLKRVQ